MTIETNSVEILLVEDNPRDAELMIRALKKRNLANRLFHVSDGVEAIDFPKIDGLQVLKEIRSNYSTRTIPVVIVTSSKEDPDILKAYELGASSYVVKPVDFESFSEVMSNLGFYWLLINTIVEKSNPEMNL